LPVSPTAGAGPLAGVDRAAFAASLVASLRRAGISVGFSSLETLSAALAEVAPDSLSVLYWTTRLTLIKREQDLACFNEVFAAVFETDHLPLDPHARRDALSPPPRPDDVAAPVTGGRSSPDE